LKIGVDRSASLSGLTRGKVESLLASVNGVFRRRFGLGFLARAYESWDPEKNPRSALCLLNDLRRKVPRGEAEIVIGIVSADRMNGSQCGFASYAHGYIVLKHLEPSVLMRHVLLHELCHVFGAVDLDEPGSVMGMERVGDKFDEFTTRVLLLNRERTFGDEPFVPEDEDLDELILLHERRDRMNPRETGLRFALATLYLMRGRLEEAAAECREILEASPDSLETYNLLGNIYHCQGDLEQAIDSYRRTCELNPELPDVHFNLGLVCSKKGDDASAMIEYQRAIELDPGLAIARANLGSLYLKLGDPDRAIAACRSALRDKPRLPEALCTLGAALVVKSVTSVAGAPILIPDFPEGNAGNLAGPESIRGLVEEAIACCLEATRLKPGLAEPHNVLGAAYGFLGREQEAEAEFLEALSIRPGFLEAHFNLGVLYFRKKELEKAALQLARILEADPSPSGLAYQILDRAFQLRSVHVWATGTVRERND
jgi:tetratricopeptide (TPR) repeat protein